MVRIFAGLVLVLAIYLFGTIEEKKRTRDVSSFNYVSVDTSLLTYRKRVYVPVNLQQKAGGRQGKVVLKVRNTSFSDSIYVSRVDYYDRQGRLLKNIIDSTVLIKPMATGEIVMKSKELRESVDNLIVQWHSNGISKPLVQALILNYKNDVIMSDSGIVLSDELTTME